MSHIIANNGCNSLFRTVKDFCTNCDLGELKAVDECAFVRLNHLSEVCSELLLTYGTETCHLITLVHLVTHPCKYLKSSSSNVLLISPLLMSTEQEITIHCTGCCLDASIRLENFLFV